MTTNERQMTWTYSLVNASENKSGIRSATPKNAAYEMVGADCSMIGGVRPFPGFKRVHEFTAIKGIIGSDAEESRIVDCFPISFRVGVDQYGYGFVYRITYPGSYTTRSHILIDYRVDGFDDGDWQMGEVILAPGDIGFPPMDVVVFGRYVYVLMKGFEPILFYLDFEVSAVATGSITIDTNEIIQHGVCATGSITVTGVITNGHTFPLIDNAATPITKTFVFDTSVTTVDGSVNGSGQVIIGLSGANDTNANRAARINTTINAQAFVGIVSTNSGSAVCTVRQAIHRTGTDGGEDGNTTINMTGVTNVGSVNFTGGTDNGADAPGNIAPYPDSITVTDIVSLDTEWTAHDFVTGVHPGGTGARDRCFKVEANANDTAATLAADINAQGSFVATAAANVITVSSAISGRNANNPIVINSALHLVEDGAGISATGLSGGTGAGVGTDYLQVIETDTGPGLQPKILSPEDETPVALPYFPAVSLDPPTDGSPATGHAFITEGIATNLGVDTFWDVTPTLLAEEATNFKAGNYAIAYVLEDPSTGRKTSLSEVAEVKEAQIVSAATGTIEFLTDTLTEYDDDTIIINDGINSAVTFTFKDNIAGTTGSGTQYQVGLDGVAETAVAYANEMEDAINEANDNNDLKITADRTAAVLTLTHDINTLDGNSLMSASDPTTITLTGMAGAVEKSPANIGIEIVYDSGKFTKAYIYRSVRVQDAGGAYSASIVQLDRIITLSDYWTINQYMSSTAGTPLTGDFKRAVYYFTLDDFALIYQEPYTDRSIFDENMPKAGAGIEFDGILLASDIAGDTAAGVSNEDRSLDRYRGLGEFRWSSIKETSPELFPPENYYVPSKVANQVTRFEKSGGAVLGFADNVIMHITRESTGNISYLKVLPIHEGYGSVNKRAVKSVGPHTFYVNNKGIKSVDAQGRLDSLHALDGVIESWKGDYAFLSMSYDSDASILFIHNSSKKQTALMWFGTSKVSELHDMPFELTTTGPWYSDLSDENSDLTERAFFIQNQPDVSAPETNFHCCAYVMDSKRESVISGSAVPAFNGQSRISLLHGHGDLRFSISGWDSLNDVIEIANDDTNHAGGVAPLLTSRNHQDLIGAYVYLMGGVGDDKYIGGKAQISKIKSESPEVPTKNNKIYVVNKVGFSPVIGDRIAISPVFVRWAGSLLGYNDTLDQKNPAPSGLHTSRHINALGCYFTLVGGAPVKDGVDTIDQFFKANIYEGEGVVGIESAFPVDTSGNKIKSLTDGESTYWAAFGGSQNVDGLTSHGIRGLALSPTVEVFCPDLDFRLLSVIIDGKILSTRRTERPT